MVIDSSKIVGGAAALAVVGIGLWVSTAVLSPPATHATVEVQQIEDRSWTVEVKELGTADAAAAKTASR